MMIFQICGWFLYALFASEEQTLLNVKTIWPAEILRFSTLNFSSFRVRNRNIAWFRFCISSVMGTDIKPFFWIFWRIITLKFLLSWILNNIEILKNAAFTKTNFGFLQHRTIRIIKNLWFYKMKFFLWNQGRVPEDLRLSQGEATLVGNLTASSKSTAFLLKRSSFSFRKSVHFLSLFFWSRCFWNSRIK